MKCKCGVDLIAVIWKDGMPVRIDPEQETDAELKRLWELTGFYGVDELDVGTAGYGHSSQHYIYNSKGEALYRGRCHSDIVQNQV